MTSKATGEGSAYCQHLGDIVPATRTLPAYCCSCGDDLPGEDQDPDMFDDPAYGDYVDDKIDRLKEARHEGH